MSAYEARFQSYRVSNHGQEFQCPVCGEPQLLGDRAVEDLEHGECYCSRHCAKRDTGRKLVTGWGDVRRILKQESHE